MCKVLSFTLVFWGPMEQAGDLCSGLVRPLLCGPVCQVLCVLNVSSHPDSMGKEEGKAGGNQQFRDGS